jgi:hypothetical protein
VNYCRRAWILTSRSSKCSVTLSGRCATVAQRAIWCVALAGRSRSTLPGTSESCSRKRRRALDLRSRGCCLLHGTKAFGSITNCQAVYPCHSYSWIPIDGRFAWPLRSSAPIPRRLWPRRPHRSAKICGQPSCRFPDGACSEPQCRKTPMRDQRYGSIQGFRLHTNASAVSFDSVISCHYPVAAAINPGSMRVIHCGPA